VQWSIPARLAAYRTAHRNSSGFFLNSIGAVPRACSSAYPTKVPCQSVTIGTSRSRLLRLVPRRRTSLSPMSVALRPHRGAHGDAERGARRVVGLELGQELV